MAKLPDRVAGLTELGLDITDGHLAIMEHRGREHGISTGTLDALRKNRSVTLHTINDLCRILRCGVSDIIRYVPEDAEE